MKVRYHPEARAELLAAVDWYEERRDGLGQDLHGEVERAERAVVQNPERWPQWPGAGPGIRRCVLPRFPFSVAFQVQAPTP